MRGCQQTLTLLSANVRGLRTNIGELNLMTLSEKPDIIACTETFLDSTVAKGECKISGYSQWERRDRVNGQKGGVAVCFKKDLHIQPLSPVLPDLLEIMFFKIITARKQSILLCVMYRPQWQGSYPIEYLHTNLDNLMLYYNCSNVILLGDWNQHLVQNAFDTFLTVYELHNHVDFPTHDSGSSLDPVISDIPSLLLSCKRLSTVGTSDHNAVLTRFVIDVGEDKRKERTLWQWGRTNWEAAKADLQNTDWNILLQGSIDNQVTRLTNKLLDIQRKYVPHRSYVEKPHDPPWFGHQCRNAANAKYESWRQYKKRPSSSNKNVHKQACIRLRETLQWAKSRWTTDLRHKLQRGNIAAKEWWNLTKNMQGLSREDLIPPLTCKNGSTATSNMEKAETLALHFAEKMTVLDPESPAPILLQRTRKKLNFLNIQVSNVQRILEKLNVSKATGPDGVSPHLLRSCAAEVASPLTLIFTECFSETCWPSIWKSARIVPVHKKDSKSKPSNYRPISLLPVIAKVFEEIIVQELCEHLDDNRLLSPRQFGFVKGKSASDLLLLLSHKWSQNLDNGYDTRVIALDISGAFDTVWHNGLLSKIKSLGIEGNFLALLKDYLSDRSITVVVGGEESGRYPIKAGVPQGSLLGPLMWNIFFDDLLQQIPEAVAYADDLTIHLSFSKGNANTSSSRLQGIIDIVSNWGSCWKINFAAEKSQSLIISRSRDRITRNKALFMQERLLQEQDSINILGVTFDFKLNFGQHIESLARKATQKLNALRRILHLLSPEGALQLYKSQVRSALEYSSLAWNGAAQTHLSLLDKIQDRAVTLIGRTANEADINVDDLQRRRDVAGLTVLYKAQHLDVPHLAPLKQQPRRSARRTRATQQNPAALSPPTASTSHFQRHFICRYVNLWNDINSENDIPFTCSIQTFKCFVNRILS